MESAVSSVGTGITDDQVNELTLRHFENLQVCQLPSYLSPVLHRS